jgi:hypothetical protein
MERVCHVKIYIHHVIINNYVHTYAQNNSLWIMHIFNALEQIQVVARFALISSFNALEIVFDHTSNMMKYIIFHFY